MENFRYGGKAMGDDLKQKVRKWLEKHGGPVELQTARAFQDADFSISQGFHFVDHATGKTRECDLLAHRHESSGGSPSVTIHVDFLIECKRSTDPWVAFSVHDHELNQDSKLAPHTWIMDDLARRHLAHIISSRWSDNPNIYDDRPTAYSISLVKFKNSQGAPFTAANQLLDAVYSRMKRMAEDGLPNSLRILIPVIVLDGKLFEYFLCGDEEMLEDRDEVTLLLRDRTLSFTGRERVQGFARIRIVTLETLPSFATRAKGMASWICGLAPDVCSSVIDEKRGPSRITAAPRLNHDR
jgi:hypothetical protein